MRPSLLFFPTLLLASFGAASARADEPTEIVITLGGDTGFTRNGNVPDEAGAWTAAGRFRSLDELTKGIAKLPDGDLNFLNLETVVTERADLAIVPKGYNFRSHPDAVSKLISLGFNLFSNANNHSYDFGFEGFRETIRNMAALAEAHPGIGYSGLGRTVEEALTPAVLERKDSRFAFLAAGFLENDAYRPNAKHPGQLNVRRKSDLEAQLGALENSDADFRILSVHDGIEQVVLPSGAERERYAAAVSKHGVDLVVGHHPHVVRPIERVGDGLVIHSLGNFLLLGAANLNGAPLERSYGLFVRVFLSVAPGGRPEIQALEAIPITNMSEAPKALGPKAARERIAALNALARKLGPGGLELRIRESDGAGYACLGNRPGPRAAGLCPP
jgi:poly-gamma-glutamate synthesis protein (capsule biosynthesis protein)